MATDDVRFPLAPLAERMRKSEHQASAELGLSGSTQQQARKRGLTAVMAERLAERAGFHPYEIWPELRDHHIAQVETVCPQCSGRFLASNGNQRYCSSGCMRAAASVRRRAKYAADAGERARRRAVSARYYAQARGYVRRRQQSGRAVRSETLPHPRAMVPPSRREATAG